MQTATAQRLACAASGDRDRDSQQSLCDFPALIPAISLPGLNHFGLVSPWVACYFAANVGGDRPLTTPTPEPPDDFALLRAIVDRDKAAFQQFYERHSATLFSLALKILGDRPDAEDVLQNMFMQVWKIAPAFDESRGKPLAWLIMLTRSRAIDRLRSRQTRARVIDTIAQTPHDEKPGPSEQAATGETHGIVRRALGSLSAEQRTPIELAYFGGLTQSEIARKLGEPLGTIKTRMRTGMIRLREQFSSPAAETREELRP